MPLQPNLDSANPTAQEPSKKSTPRHVILAEHPIPSHTFQSTLPCRAWLGCPRNLALRHFADSNVTPRSSCENNSHRMPQRHAEIAIATTRHHSLPQFTTRTTLSTRELPISQENGTWTLRNTLSPRTRDKKKQWSSGHSARYDGEPTDSSNAGSRTHSAGRCDSTPLPLHRLHRPATHISLRHREASEQR